MRSEETRRLYGQYMEARRRWLEQIVKDHDEGVPVSDLEAYKLAKRTHRERLEDDSPGGYRAACEKGWLGERELLLREWEQRGENYRQYRGDWEWYMREYHGLEPDDGVPWPDGDGDVPVSITSPDPLSGQGTVAEEIVLRLISQLAGQKNN